MEEDEQLIDPVHFNDGCVIKRDYVYIAAKRDSPDPEDGDYSILFWSERMEDGSLAWHLDTGLNANVVSVCFDYALDGTFALGAHGEVYAEFYEEEKPQREQLPDAGIHGADRLGAMNQVRSIGRTIGRSVYACGAHGQVYRRGPKGWAHLDATLIDRSEDRPLSLNSIDGSAEDDIFAVGYNGRIVHFDGQRWRELDSPTNLHLERVCSTGRGEAYICGNEGTLLRVADEGIVDFSADIPAHFWGLTVFEGRPYVATLAGLYVLGDDDELEEVDVGLDQPVGFYRLDSEDGVLWSFGAKDLLRFDGQRWERIPFSPNEE